MQALISFISIFVLLQAGNVTAESAPWNQFRGPNGSGVANAFKPPLAFDASKPAWKTPLPSGHSSPVVSEGKIFVTGLRGKQFVTIALDSETGSVRWERNAPLVPLENVHTASSPASSTPCADDSRVYVYFGSYGLLCYDHDGNDVWTKEIPTPKSMYGTSTSPILHGELLILVLDDDANLEGSRLSRSRIVALNRKTGDLVWATSRPYNRSGWSTPMIWTHQGESVLAVIGNGRAYAYDPINGEAKWYVNGFSRETIAVPVAGDGQLYFSASRQGGWGDSEIDPGPFWEAALAFDVDGDGRVGREEISEHFTIPFRPELPPGHPGFGMPLPGDPEKRLERQRGLFDMRDQNKDGFWTKDEFNKDMQVGRGTPNLAAVKPGGTGDVTDTHVAWNLRTGIPEIPSPIHHKGRLYLVRSGGVLSCVNAESSELIYKERLGAMGQYAASPVIANDHLFFVSNRGVISIVKSGDRFDLVHQTDLGVEVPATPALDQETLYVRTVDGLVAFR